ncbi:MAG: sec-independent translocation protein MttA [Flavobacteriaceae bacterium]|nr:sec-independent translocation protein MttA [Flavobacteriaceae bacterium]|tara:strand:+ start:8090 stop:8362 length:273 start_codon:yes stop_codon:yes gene_type:complete
MVLFISGAEIALIFFIVLLVFGADKIPSIARGMAKGITQIRHATNEIKSEIQKSSEIDGSSTSVAKKLNEEIKTAKKNMDELTDSIKREL